MGSARSLKKLISDLSRLWGIHTHNPQFKLFVSALVDHNPRNSTEEIISWLKELNSRQYFNVEEIEFSAMQQWAFNSQTQDLEHKSGKFFSITGMEVYDAQSGKRVWDQPIIDQPEIGVLGILCKEIDGVLCLLMQAKAEPGNLNTYQLSPTVQATRSNYLQVHGGRRTKYLEFFNGDKPVEVVLDQYQSEQGARFLHKRNRNILVICDQEEDIDCSDNYRWITLGQLKTLMEIDNTVNMDSRSIISMIDYAISDCPVDAKRLLLVLNEYRDMIIRSDFWIKTICSYLSKAKPDISIARNSLTWRRYYQHFGTRRKALRSVQDWDVNNRSMDHKSGKYFQVLAVRVTANNREVDFWDQPIIRQRHHGDIALLCNECEDEIGFLVHMKHEPGLYDMIEYAPTVQCIAENYDNDHLPPYYHLLKSGQAVYSAYQSEEGGRFYQECSRNQIIVMPDIRERQIGFVLLNLGHLKQMLQYQQMINVELRSLLAYF
jgi:oxidase EvaA